MEFIRLTDSNHAMYHQAMDLYKASFPIHEQRESHVQMSRFAQNVTELRAKRN